MTLDGHEQLSALKVYGSAPYRLRVTGRDGSTIGFPSIDLATLSAGWHVIESSALISTDIVELRFEATGAPGKIREIELWASADASASALVDLTANELPAGFVELVPDTKSADLAPGDCTTFELELRRAPSTFERVHLVFEAEGLFRTFALERSINGLAHHGGTWLAGDPTRRAFIDEIDPSVLHLGRNELRFCLPTVANRGVALADLHLVGDLDQGSGLVADVGIGTGEIHGDALFDGNADTAVDISGRERIVLSFDRSIAPDAILMSGRSVDPDAIASIECLDRNSGSSSLAITKRIAGNDAVVALDGGGQACAALALTFATEVTLAAVDVVGSGAGEAVDWPRIVVTSPREHFGDSAWIAGFIKRPAAMTGAIRVQVADRPADAMTGDFGRLLTRTAGTASAWPVGVSATFPDGTTKVQEVILDRDQRAQLAVAQTMPSMGSSAGTSGKRMTPFGAEGDSVVKRARKLEATSIRLGTHVGVDVPIGAVEQNTNITVRHLGEDVLPPLDSGMINVTAPKGRGYEFLPHGQRFKKAVEVVVPYDAQLIPEGMSPEDVHTYFYDPKAERWIKLDRAAIDVGQRVIRSSTDHFTIMINAVLTVPKNPTPLSFDPTTLTSIAAASPAANIDFIQPPTATSTGDARLSLPVRLPRGRGAYSPALAFTYSSGAGNSWLGVGWDVPISRIEIDTRWGVPTYAAGEEPRYLLDGTALVPTLDTDGPSCRNGRPGQRYHARIEGAFFHILRCNHAPGGLEPASHYGFEVRDANGTLFIYGVDSDADPELDPRHTALTDPRPPHAIFRWYLREVVDVHGNTTSFHYQRYNFSAGEPGREIYPRLIEYTSHPASGKSAAYRVEFYMDDGSRPDHIVSGRAGFKTWGRHLLRKVRVLFGHEVIRDYVLTYRHGQFDKSVLSRVSVFGLGGDTTSGLNAFEAPDTSGAAFFHEHRFDWYRETEGFGQMADLTMGGPDEVRKAPLARGHTSGVQGGFSLGASIFDGTTEELADLTVGGDLGTASRQELVGMYDVDGNGTPDQAVLGGDENSPAVLAYLNTSGPGQLPASMFEPRPGFALAGLAGMGKERRNHWSVNATASAKGVGSASAGISDSTTRATHILADLNGDGWLDHLRPDSGTFGALLGRPCEQGLCFDPTPYRAASHIDPLADSLLGTMGTRIRQRLVLADPVVQWTAPYTGRIAIRSRARKLVAGGADGVGVELYHQDQFLSGATLAPGETSEIAIASELIVDVSAGEAIYLRTTTFSDDGLGTEALDRVDAHLLVEYRELCTTGNCVAIEGDVRAPHDPTGAGVYTFDSRRDFRIAGTPSVLIAPVQGTIEVRGQLVKHRSAADLRVCLQKFPAASPTFSPDLDAPCDATGTDAQNVLGTMALYAGSEIVVPLVATIPVATGELVLLRVESDLSFDPSDVALALAPSGEPLLAFREVCPSDDSGTPLCTTDPDELRAYPLPSIGRFGPHVVLRDPPGVPPRPVVVPGAGTNTIVVDPIASPLFTSGFLFAVRSDRQGLLFHADCRVASCGTIQVPPLAVTGGESISFETVGSAPFLLGDITGSFASGDVFAVPMIQHAAESSSPPLTPFAGGYHGFRVAFWNEREPFSPAQLLADYPLFGTELLSDERRQEIARTVISPVHSFGGDPLTGGAPAWVGPHSAAFVTASDTDLDGVLDSAGLNAGYIGLFLRDEATVAAGGAPGEIGGLFTGGYVRLSGTSSKFIGLSTSLAQLSVTGFSLSLSGSKSDTTTTTDVVDMNGDGIADVVAGELTTLGDFTASPGGLRQTTGFSFKDHPDDDEAGLRERHGFDYAIDLGGGASVQPITSSSGRTLQMLSVGGKNSLIGFSVGIGIGVGRSQTTDDLRDVNGDGLPDKVRRRGSALTVQLNLGHRFGKGEPFGQVLIGHEIDRFQRFEDETDWFGEGLTTSSNALTHSTTLTQSRKRSVDLIIYHNSKVSRLSSTRTTRDLADINGDGLPDILLKRDRSDCDDGDASNDCKDILVQFNRGGDFAAPVKWQTPPWRYADGTPVQLAPIFDDRVSNALFTGPDVLSGTGLDRSVTTSHSGTLYIPTPIPDVIVHVGGSYATSEDTDTFELALMDLDGDGAPEHVLRRTTVGGTPTIYVKRNQITGRANLLHRVHGPLGSTISLEYTRVGNTVDMPQSRQVLTRVEVDDGVILPDEFASPNTVSTIAYEGGVFHRNEKEFFGFRTVKTTRSDGGVIEEEYENAPDKYALRGHLVRQTRKDSSGNLFLDKRFTYAVRDVVDEAGDPVAPHPGCLAQLHSLLAAQPDACAVRLPVVTEERETRAEGGTASKTRVIRDLAFDRFGHVLESIDEADDAIASDDVYARAEYHHDSDRWILGRPTLLEVRVGNATGTVLRARSATYTSLGDLETVSISTGSGIATSTLAYDTFGNLKKITTPPNANHQTQDYEVVEYDAATASFPVRTRDGFGYESTAEYDLRFGVATTETDLNGQQLHRTLDAFGRLSRVRGPYDPAGSPGLTMQYFTREAKPRAKTVTRASAPADYTGPVPTPITSITVTDGLGGPIQVRKTSVVGGVLSMTTSGLVKRDAEGNVVATYQPFHTPGVSDAFALPTETPLATLTTYDAIDRPIRTTFPDGAIETTSYDIVPDPDGRAMFVTRTVAANGNPRETYTDHAGRTRAFVEHPNHPDPGPASITRYDYLATGELSRIVDAEGNVSTLAYDLRGLRTRLDNPDTGLIEDRYDLMGNRVATIEPNHRALGVEVRYVFNRNRLEQIDYPSKPDVAFAYGGPGAPNGRVGRLASVTDESGTQEHFYGALGEVRRTVRTVRPDEQGSQPVVFETSFVSDSLGRQLQLRYPDGVVVTNTFDAGGMLARVEGAGTGWTRTYASDLQYDVFGNRTQMRLGNGALTTWTYDPKRVRLETLTTVVGSSQKKLQDLRYTYDSAGNPTKIVNQLAQLTGGSGNMPGESTLSLRYDGVDRLTRAHGDAQLSAQKRTNYVQTFAYSPSHNITHKARTHLITQPNVLVATAPVETNFASNYAYAPGRPHLPEQIGDLQITYDPSGNPMVRRKQATGSQQVLVWDDDNRLVDFTSGGVHQHNTYDASGLRVRRKSTQSETLFANQYFDLENGTQGVRHVFAGDLRVASELGRFNGGENPTPPDKLGTVYFFHQDHLGSTSLLTTIDGTVHESIEYFVDGETWIDRGPQKPVNRYLFSGKPYDPDTGFYDFGQRFYDPRTSLWLGNDPAFAGDATKAIGHPLFLSTSAFGGLNPLRFRDPDGREIADIAEIRTCSRAECPGYVRNGATDALVVDWSAVRGAISRQSTRIKGAMKVGLGVAGAVAGTALCAIPGGCAVGGPLIVASSDVAGSGVVELVTNESTPTLVGHLAGPKAQEIEETFVSVGAMTAPFVPRPGVPPSTPAPAQKGAPPSKVQYVDPNTLKPTQELAEMSKSQVTKMAKDMKKHGTSKYPPIHVANHQGKLYIVDGHHRATAASAAKQPIPARITPAQNPPEEAPWTISALAQRIARWLQ